MASIPDARWAGPEDTERDLHYEEFEAWVNDLYERNEYRDFGFYGDFESALDSDFMFDLFMDIVNRSKEI
jgi:hypothetical protein